MTWELEEEELDDADALWLYDKAKKLHNSDLIHLNARAMSKVNGLKPNAATCAAASTCSRLQPREVRPGAQPVFTSCCRSGSAAGAQDG